MDVSIIIVNYNTAEITLQTINSVIEKTKGLSYEIIVVDNNSHDDSKKMLSDLPNVQFIALCENIGFGMANNVGIDNAKGEYILLLNPDTILVNNAIKILRDFLLQNTTCGVCGGNLYHLDMTPTASFGRLFYGIKFELNRAFLFLPTMIRYGRNLWFNYTDKPMKVAHIVGADMMFPAKLLPESNRFDPRFFMYCEETELCLRIKRMGYSCYSVPQAKIIHLEGVSFQFSEAREIRFLEGRHTYFKIVKPRLNYKIANIIAMIAMINRALVYLLMAKPQKAKLYFEKTTTFRQFLRQL